MPVMGWIAIGVFIGGIIWTVVWWLATKRSDGFESRLTALELAVVGDNGLRAKLGSLVTAEALESRMVVMAQQLSAVKEEGERREERILEAIREQTRVIGSAVSDVRSDLRSQALRIDAIFRKGD